VTNGVTFYPGVGADEAIAELHSLVGEITANWASVEDNLCRLFVVAIAGTWLVPDIRPYRAVFFTFSSYEGKMRMVHNAMKARYGENKEVMNGWKELRDCLNGFSDLRNEIVHLVPMAQSSTSPTAKANVRLIPPFWKSAFQEQAFNNLGYSADELWKALRPYWGYHPRIHGLNPPGERLDYQLSYRLEQFAIKLEPLTPSSKDHPPNP
jgi:hypothetical protein